MLSHPQISKRIGTPILQSAQIDPGVRHILERACQDCHSETSEYPWYSYVVPISYLINHDVSAGREHLNLSLWSRYSKVRRERLLSEIANQVKEREMPLWSYTLVHSRARLSNTDIEAIFRWSQAERMRLILEDYTADLTRQ